MSTKYGFQNIAYVSINLEMVMWGLYRGGRAYTDRVLEQIHGRQILHIWHCVISIGIGDSHLELRETSCFHNFPEFRFILTSSHR